MYVDAIVILYYLLRSYKLDIVKICKMLFVVFCLFYIAKCVILGSLTLMSILHPTIPEIVEEAPNEIVDSLWIYFLFIDNSKLKAVKEQIKIKIQKMNSSFNI